MKPSSTNGQPMDGTTTVAGTTHDVLVVDDNPANLVAIEAAIGDLAPALVKVGSGEEALRRLLDRDFSLILLDVQMPGMNGFEAARLIRQRERTRLVPIIFVTGFGRSDNEMLRGYELGAVDFLFKPIIPEVLRAKVNVFIELSRQEQRVRQLERQAFEGQLARERQHWRSQLLERRMAEQKRINADLEHAAQQKNDFLAVLCHELRNPLAPVLSALELMKLRGLDDPQLDAVRDAAERQTKHLVRLVDDLLDISRIERGLVALRTSVRDLRDLLEVAGESAVPLVNDKGQRLVVDLPDEPVWVEVDDVRIHQIIGNLLNNASRYSGHGAAISMRLVADDGHATLSVEDEGRGIDPEALETVFEAFTREARDGPGLGLGLTVVRRLAELHGGDVTAHSAGEGQGSRFEVRLPTCSAKPVVDEVPSPPPAPPRTTIVVVEDDEDIRLGTRALLRAHGHVVDVAADGVSGLSKVDELRPEVVLIDIGLPGMDGFEIARRLRAEHGDDAPLLIAVTGYGQERDKRRAREAGFDDHLVKPTAIEEIHDAIRRARRTPTHER